MSPVGARRALGSSIMDGSCLAVVRTALQGACADLFSGVACVRQSLQGARFAVSAQSSIPPTFPTIWTLVYETLIGRASHNLRRQLVPAGSISFLISQFNFRSSGIISGVGITRFRPAGKLRA